VELPHYIEGSSDGDGVPRQAPFGLMTPAA